MKLCVIGAGYVGLVTAAVFAELGHEVACVDANREKLETLRGGHSPFFEPELDELVRRYSETGALTFTGDILEGLAGASIAFICVGTPPAADGAPDLRFVEHVARDIGRAARGDLIVVNKSTVPVGTGRRVAALLAEHAVAGARFDVVSNPEFLREGTAIQDARHPDRIVVGSESSSAADKVAALYATLERPVIVTDIASAELIKYASNAYLATRISFTNFIADLCEASGADILQVTRGMGTDVRIGPQFLHAGLGYGGSCFPKDTSAIAHTAHALGVDASLPEAVIRVNEARPERMLHHVREALGGTLRGATLGMLGLAFKPNTDDVRDARSLDIVRIAVAEGAAVQAYDPVAMPNALAAEPRLACCPSAYEASRGADALLLVTEWPAFRSLDLHRLRGLTAGNHLFDGRNLLDPAEAAAAGFVYRGMGRPAVATPSAA